ncbi:MAG: cupin domain-containing protein [Methylococcaceae bacterium]|nr:cupin domain-containing protein [Methylococcaceae bacterium]
MLNNIFANIPLALPEEYFETLFQKSGVQIERIISKGHVTAEQEWYDQAWDEWLILLQGSATLVFENAASVNIMPGDYCLIPARTRHRVSQTDLDTESIWLAVHLR